MCDALAHAWGVMQSEQSEVCVERNEQQKEKSEMTAYRSKWHVRS